MPATIEGELKTSRELAVEKSDGRKERRAEIKRRLLAKTAAEARLEGLRQQLARLDAGISDRIANAEQAVEVAATDEERLDANERLAAAVNSRKRGSHRDNLAAEIAQEESQFTARYTTVSERLLTAPGVADPKLRAAYDGCQHVIRILSDRHGLPAKLRESLKPDPEPAGVTWLIRNPKDEYHDLTHLQVGTIWTGDEGLRRRDEVQARARSEYDSRVSTNREAAIAGQRNAVERLDDTIAALQREADDLWRQMVAE